jgi:hypothetical protein
MGHTQSVHSANDFELVIRSAKELERILRDEFGAHGNGVNEMLDCINARGSSEFSPESLKRMRHLIWIRNQLVHEPNFNSIPDRGKLFLLFEVSQVQFC